LPARDDIRPKPASTRRTAVVTSIKRRMRSEHLVSRVEQELRPAGPARAAADRSRPPDAPAASSPIRTKAPPTPEERRFADIEESLSRRSDERIARKITEAMERTLKADSIQLRKMTDLVYTALYDRIVLEKERLG